MIIDKIIIKNLEFSYDFPYKTIFEGLNLEIDKNWKEFELHYKEGYNGNKMIFSVVNENNDRGLYNFEFRAKDRSNKLSNIINHSVLIQ